MYYKCHTLVVKSSLSFPSSQPKDGCFSPTLPSRTHIPRIPRHPEDLNSNCQRGSSGVPKQHSSTDRPPHTRMSPRHFLLNEMLSSSRRRKPGRKLRLLLQIDREWRISRSQYCYRVVGAADSLIHYMDGLALDLSLILVKIEIHFLIRWCFRGEWCLNFNC